MIICNAIGNDSMEVIMDIGKQIKTLRLAKGVTQEELAANQRGNIQPLCALPGEHRAK